MHLHSLSLSLQNQDILLCYSLLICFGWWSRIWGQIFRVGFFPKRISHINLIITVKKLIIKVCIVSHSPPKALTLDVAGGADQVAASARPIMLQLVAKCLLVGVEVGGVEGGGEVMTHSEHVVTEHLATYKRLLIYQSLWGQKKTGRIT